MSALGPLKKRLSNMLSEPVDSSGNSYYDMARQSEKKVTLVRVINIIAELERDDK